MSTHPKKGAVGQTWICDQHGAVVIVDGTDWDDDQLLRILLATRGSLDAALLDMADLAKTCESVDVFRRAALSLIGAHAQRSPNPVPQLAQAWASA